jgi:Protein of unknown function (DUF1566)
MTRSRLMAALCLTTLLTVDLMGQRLTRLSAAPPEYDAMTVQDPARHLVWLRCSIGQTWNGHTCLGEPQALNLQEAQQSSALARAELAGNWRLPSKAELESLVCRECQPLKIDGLLYPNTAPGAYWTQSVNTFNSSLYWSVSFQNGYSFGRNPVELTHFVRLVSPLNPLE